MLWDAGVSLSVKVLGCVGDFSGCYDIEGSELEAIRSQVGKGLKVQQLQDGTSLIN